MEKEEHQQQHRIQTIQDMVDVVTRQNIDCLMGDLRNHLVTVMTARETGRMYCPRPGVMNWIDDGQCNIYMSSNPVSGMKATAPSMEPAVRVFDDCVKLALERLLNEAIEQSVPITTVPSTAVPPQEIPSIIGDSGQEAWVSSEEDCGGGY
jgi:hypothetical protein